MKHLRDLRSRLLASHLVVILVTMGVLSFLFLSLGQRYFLDALESSLTAQAQVILQALIPGAALIEEPAAPLAAANTMQQVQNSPLQIETVLSGNLDPLPSSNLPALQNLTLDITPLIPTHIRITDTTGQVVFDSGQGGMNPVSADALPLTLEASRTARVPMTGGDWFYVSIPFLLYGRQAGVIAIGQPLGDVQAVLADLQQRVLISALVGVLLAAAAALLLAGRLARPIRQLTEASRALSLGDFNVPLNPAGNDEISDLTRTFEDMRSQIRREKVIREQFLSDVSHELRTPLTVIKGLTETLQDGAVEDPPARDRFLTSMEHETDRLIRLTTDLLTLSRADAGELHLDLQPLEMSELLEHVCELYEVHARQSDIDLSFSPPVDQTPVLADPDRIEQTLVILLDNALKHTPPGGRITVSCPPAQMAQAVLPAGQDPDAMILVHVHDTGTGIPPQSLPHVFDRFYRPETSRSRQTGGSGLGLAIARSLIHTHGGSIWLLSPAWPPGPVESPGTSAFFSLPVFHTR